MANKLECPYCRHAFYEDELSLIDSPYYGCPKCGRCVYATDKFPAEAGTGYFVGVGRIKLLDYRKRRV